MSLDISCCGSNGGDGDAEACALCGGAFVEHLNLPRRGTCTICGHATCAACREDRGYRYDDDGTLEVTAAVCNACLPIYEAVRKRFAWDAKEDDAFWDHCRKVAGVRANAAPGPTHATAQSPPTSDPFEAELLRDHCVVGRRQVKTAFEQLDRLWDTCNALRSTLDVIQCVWSSIEYQVGRANPKQPRGPQP